jgi:hypothetical protein
MKLIFPITIISLDLGASIVYLFLKDYRHAFYWAFAAGLTICVTI